MTHPFLSVDFDSRFLSRVVPVGRPPGGTVAPSASAALMNDTPEQEVIRDNLGSVRVPTDASVSAIEAIDCRTVSGREDELPAPVVVLLRLDEGGEEELSAIEDGRSLGTGAGCEWRFITEDLRVNFLGELGVPAEGCSGLLWFLIL